MRRQRDAIKPEFEQRICELEEKLAKTRKENENLRASNKKAEKDRADAIKKLTENQKLFKEIECCIDEDEASDEESQSDKQVLANTQPKKIGKFILEKLKDYEKILSDSVQSAKLIDQKDKKIKKLTTEIQTINSQTLDLMQKISAECLQDDIPKPKKATKNIQMDLTQFDKIDPKTIALSAQTIEHINSIVTFQTCENTALQQQINKMQNEINQANGVKTEILTDFDKIK